jgi:hypothetical protein
VVPSEMAILRHNANFAAGEDMEIALFGRCDRLQGRPPVGHFR